MTDGPVANQTERSNKSAFIGPFSSQADRIGDTVENVRLLFVSVLPLLQIPDFESTPPTHEHDLAFEVQEAAHLGWQNETPLLVGCAELRAGMRLAKKLPRL